MEEQIFAQLRRFVTAIVTLSEADWACFRAAFVLQRVPAHLSLCAPGDVAGELFFVASGLLRLYYTKPSGDDITAFLFSEGLFASCYESFLQQTPSRQGLETLEASELLVLDQNALAYLYERVPQTNVLTRRLAEQRFLHAQQLFASFLLDSPQQRYEQFAHQYPDLLQRVPQYYIASFLGITPVSLSRIRGRLQRMPRP